MKTRAHCSQGQAQGEGNLLVTQAEKLAKNKDIAVLRLESRQALFEEEGVDHALGLVGSLDLFAGQL